MALLGPNVAVRIICGSANPLAKKLILQHFALVSVAVEFVNAQSGILLLLLIQT